MHLQHRLTASSSGSWFDLQADPEVQNKSSIKNFEQ